MTMPFQTGRFRRLHLLRSELCGEVSFAQGRGRTLRTPGGSRQPPDRQVRYYSEGAEEASRLFWYFRGTDRQTEVAAVEKPPHKCQSATPLWGGASALALVTGLSNKYGGSCPPSAFPRPGSASWRWLFCRVPRSLGRQSPFLAACYITGALLIAIRVPFV